MSETDWGIGNAQLEVANDSTSSTYTGCGQTGNIPDGSSETVECDSPLIARYVRLRQDTGSYVCEVTVTGHPYIGK